MKRDINPDLNNPAYYISRELTWLAFNRRVMMEAVNADNPVMERMKFLSIVSTNLDEFFMVRVASLRNKGNAGVKAPDLAGNTPKQQLNQLLPVVRQMIEQEYQIYRRKLVPDLRRAGMCIKQYRKLNAEQRDYLADVFVRDIYPLLTPLAVGDVRRFPLILNKSLNVGIFLAGKEKRKPDFATVQVPTGVPRLLRLPQELLEADEQFAGVPVEQVIARHASMLFPGRRVLCCHAYRCTRNSDFPIDDDDDEDLLVKMEKSIKKRKWGDVIRLEIAHDMHTDMIAFLRKGLKAMPDEVFPIQGPLNLDFLLKQLYPIQGFDAYHYTSFEPAIPPALKDPQRSVFDAVQEGDILLHHPYDSFEPVTRFVQEAAEDPDVLAVKMTLYRVSGHSPIIRALGDAALAGKQVTVLLEVKARFDEENNIRWGKQLERMGCQVLYGVKGLKTHAKITLVVRREEEGLRRYVHLGTGNYNDITAGLYTDMSLMTAHPGIGTDASRFFNQITGYSDETELDYLVAAPHALRGKVLELIEREQQHAMRGRPAGITVKINSLIDAQVTPALYQASRVGVPIRLHVRGICSLRPGIEGISDRIEVHSIVGRFLEHTRIFIFENGGEEEIYLASADWMVRNLDRRVELMFPVLEEAAKQKVKAAMRCCWEDNQKTWMLHADGTYTRIAQEGLPHNAQEECIATRNDPVADSRAVEPA